MRIAILLCLAFCSVCFAAEVEVIQLPEGALVPDVTVAPDGNVNMVYGLGDKALFVRSADDGRSFSEPVAVNSTGKVQLTMGERGPKLALGRNGSIHVIWMDRWSPGAQVHAKYARSTDGGKTFSEPRQLSSKAMLDGATIAADGKGNVIAFWHTFDPPQKEIKDGHWIYLARSTDDGETFAAPERLRLTDMKDLACSMCLMRARFAQDGKVHLAFRSAVDNIRDMYVLSSNPGENAFTAKRVNNDNWYIDHCPMCGPELTVDAAGSAYCAYMADHKVYWSRRPADSADFTLHVATPNNENDEIYPSATPNGNGDVLMVWQVGPMAVGQKATVHWALYRDDGSYTGQTGTLGVSTSGTKATAFATRSGDFRVITTAKIAPGQQ
jgi:hypothetical protein